MGPTGSGKTGVAIEIAREINAEIISADSRAIYKGMDIGTAKPSIEERCKVPHWGIDLVEPGERFTVADWKEYAEKKIEEIEARGKIAMVVGGTGLYIDALIYDYQFGANCESVFRGHPQLRRGRSDEARNDGPEERPRKTSFELAPDRSSVCINYLLIGVRTPSVELRKRLKERVNKMFVQELYDETEWLVKKYGWGSQAMKSNIYQYAWKYLQGEMSLDEAKEKCFYADWHLAKRQMTWFKRTSEITWLALEKVKPYVLKYIQDE
ncbi:tRNA dimethylallyltransferase [Candidatus Saccharibacteria bacterium]|nr:tRNA dimethylallyltransferase [Candidatus Saccharibacteria bacterium]